MDWYLVNVLSNLCCLNVLRSTFVQKSFGSESHTEKEEEKNKTVARFQQNVPEKIYAWSRSQGIHGTRQAEEPGQGAKSLQRTIAHTHTPTHTYSTDNLEMIISIQGTSLHHLHTCPLCGTVLMYSALCFVFYVASQSLILFLPNNTI